ncbi:MAG: anthranilate phosphoribosyltransferase [SAR324 cluster bacterium]|nr:anthranilate phosphoribosyltransferase [SAR324 cluster bacterium]
MLNTKNLLEKLLDREDLTFEEASWVMNRIMEGEVSPSQMAAILVGMRMKGETVDEVTAFAKVMREKSTKIQVKFDILIDTCGTGGDNSGSFNISTTVALLLAGGGYKIAKHGNRSMTSRSGSADLLEALGVNIDLQPDQVAQSIAEAGIGFLFAPALHTSMRNVVPVRKELAVRTIFNILGPLTNPAGANIQIIGLYSHFLVSKIIHVLRDLGSQSAFVFSGLSGLDEVCIAGDTKAARLGRDGKISEFIFNPENYGYQKALLSTIRGGSAAENSVITKDILSGRAKGPKRDIVAINAGFAIAAADDSSLELGISKAEQLLSEGAGATTIDKLVSITQSFKK